MLLPSDIARLVLGYLQEEGLTATTHALILESPNLKEYAEHTTEDGSVPACVFSLFGKGLTTILNEYVAAKAKETCHEVPAIMTSLWKKLDFTLNQIKSLQNSPALSAYQRTRSRVGAANIRRQRALSIAPAGGVAFPTVSETSAISPVHTTHSMLGHSTPVTYVATHSKPTSSSVAQIHDSGRFASRDSSVQILITEHRANQGPMSPGRRKWETPKKRGNAQGETNGTNRATTTTNVPTAEPQPEEVVDENFPQLVIQNARDKILGDRSLQEKLAENINKILANEPGPQTSKASSTVMDTDQSIDEILGLQGEIHMSDDAIHDILEQTESDPAFQALFDLFEYNKAKSNESESGDPAKDDDVMDSSSTIKPVQTEDSGTSPISNANASDTTTAAGKARAGQERKTRKAAGPTVLKKTILAPSGKSSRIENSSAKLLMSQGVQRGILPAASDPSKRLKSSVLSCSTSASPVDIDEPLNTPSAPPQTLSSTCSITANQDPLGTATTDKIPNFTSITELTSTPSSAFTTVYAGTETLRASNVEKTHDGKQAPNYEAQPATNSYTHVDAQTNFIPSAGADRLQIQSANVTEMVSSVPNSDGNQPFVTHSSTPPQSVSATSASTANSALSSSASTSAPFLPPTQKSSLTCAPGPAAPNPLTSAPNNCAADSDNVVSLKIIISDNHDEQPSVDAALNQAISSITRETIPTIYLSSPAKSPSCTPKINADEVAQAVSNLQSTEALQQVPGANPVGGKTGPVVTSTVTGVTPPSYIIHLPFDSANPALQAAPSSYILVTEPPTTDTQARPLLLPAGVSKGQHLGASPNVATPPRSQGCPTGPTLLLQSPVQPMVIPVSVMGSNALGKVQVVPNQFVALPNSVQQAEAMKPQAPAVIVKQPATTGTSGKFEENMVNMVVKPLATEQNDQQNSPTGPSHRRILSFEPSGESQSPSDQSRTKATLPTISMLTPDSGLPDKAETFKSAQQTNQTVGNNKPKRRVETIRCSEDTQIGSKFLKNQGKPLPPQRHKSDAMKKNMRKEDDSSHQEESQSKVHPSQPDSLKKPDTRSRTKSSDKKLSTDKHGDESKIVENQGSRLQCSDSTSKSSSGKDKEDATRKDTAKEASAKSYESCSEKRTSPEEVPNVTANKENEIKGGRSEPQQQSIASSSTQRDLSPPSVPVTTKIPIPKSTKHTSKTTSLAKQAAEMLQDMQGLNSPATPAKNLSAEGPDLPLPRTPGFGCSHEDLVDCHRTPPRPRRGKDGEGTPKLLLPPSTPEVPTCSPSSETGSENSINMAAHTLMILSRAAIARTGTPLKDSLRQQGVREKSTAGSKLSKKRKLPSPTATPPAKKNEKQSTSSKKKDRDRKKLLDCFPHDLDVDKFLSSLHYDE